MTRPLKFRAWDKKQKIMTYHVSVYSDGVDSPCWWVADVVDEEGNHGYTFDDVGGALMQYTGKKDSKGVEIFEGDKLDSVNKHKGEYVVKWNKDDGCWFGESSIFSLEAKTFKHREIIGNIYEDKQ